MIRAPVRVRVATSKTSCKECGREYKAGELAELALCESCGADFKHGSISIETVQHQIGARDTVSEGAKARIDANEMAARISIKRFEIVPGASAARHADEHVACHVAATARAAWVKVA